MQIFLRKVCIFEKKIVYLQAFLGDFIFTNYAN